MDTAVTRGYTSYTANGYTGYTGYTGDANRLQTVTQVTRQPLFGYTRLHRLHGGERGYTESV